jgi:hypothetical protein
MTAVRALTFLINVCFSLCITVVYCDHASHYAKNLADSDRVAFVSQQLETDEIDLPVSVFLKQIESKSFGQWAFFPSMTASQEDWILMLKKADFAAFANPARTLFSVYQYDVWFSKERVHAGALMKEGRYTGVELGYTGSKSGNMAIAADLSEFQFIKKTIPDSILKWGVKLMVKDLQIAGDGSSMTFKIQYELTLSSGALPPRVYKTVHPDLIRFPSAK